MGEHHVGLQIDENNLVTKIGHDMGGSYEYTTIKNNEQFDNCVICGKQTPYKTSTHIDLRVGYVEGAGQGCFQPNKCNQSNQSNRQLITIPKYLVEQYPNDMELGAAIRAFYWENYQ